VQLVMAVFRPIIDAVVRRMRPRWIRRATDLALSPYERFSPARRIRLPDGQRLCVVAPHPDDESIACGGLLALWAARGRQADVVFLTAGEMGSAEVRGMAAADPERSGLMADLRVTRRAEAAAALGVLGARGTWFDGADGALQGDEDRLVALLCDHWRTAPPDVIAAPYPTDRHADHAVAARIVGRAAQQMLAGDVPVLGYEVWSPAPINAVLDISAVAEVKWRAIAAHISQVATTDYVRAAQGLNTYRAISGGQNAGFAEGYHIMRCEDFAKLANSLKV
jgi:LmbE family N-acetylglucosaminyl deacetylase